MLHVGDSEVDDVKGAKEAGLSVAWVNRDGRRRRADVPAPDFEIRDLRQLTPLLVPPLAFDRWRPAPSVRSWLYGSVSGSRGSIELSARNVLEGR